MVVVTLCALAMSVVKTLGLDVVVGFSGLAWSCALVLVLALALSPLDRAIARLPYWTSFAFTPLLYCGLAFGFYVFGEAIDMPHPDYAEGTWLTRGVAEGVVMLPPVGVGMLILVAIDGAIQRGRPRDSGYYPRLANVWRGLRLPRVRLILIIGGALVVGYYASTVIEVWSAGQRPCGWIWPPKRVFVACQFLWGLLWLADCASRPRGGTMAAAIGYLFTALLMMPEGGVLRE
jgi:hypothetical protein